MNKNLLKHVINTPFYAPEQKIVPPSSRNEIFEYYTDKKGTMANARVFGKELKINPSVLVKVQAFLKKLQEGAFDPSDQDLLSNLSVHVGLNRPESLDSEVNRALEGEAEIVFDELPFKIEVTAFFWQYRWFKKNGKAVPMEEVKLYYNELLKSDEEKAKRFRLSQESGVTPPFQEIREFLKNHQSTKNLVKQFRKIQNSQIYLTLIDSDTINFNGVFSAYQRICRDHFPTVMSTGYEFDGTKKEDHPFRSASKIDRIIRIATAVHFFFGVYYPEPNLCIKVEEGEETVKESFIDIRRKNHESAVLLSQVLQERHQATFVFSGDKPIITTIPNRARLIKQSGNPIMFSQQFLSDPSAPTKSDLTKIKNISQSHFDNLLWAKSLYTNRGFSFTPGKRRGRGKNSYTTFNSVMPSLRNSIASGQDKKIEQCIEKLKKLVAGEDVNKLIMAAFQVEYAISKWLKLENLDWLKEMLEKYCIIFNVSIYLCI
ncbi:hypothetical protein CYY_002932 [Polysphondylium violaceum]|uniref:Uncharacterized protein n=1 Tax=Polysphondylium violaceum TaxID=133409 RepID=A0A8J4V0I8_9MYCE|nr:hypothetical protein CYY_002932 [Polysphondylium violaceum]